MGLFEKLNLQGIPSIDWEMTPDYTFGTFESWGGKERVRSGRERIYYFFIDNWDETPRLCLMERGIKHARIVAEILAPEDMVSQCVKSQGKAVFDKNYGINREIEGWLRKNIIENFDDSKVSPIALETVREVRETGLPSKSEPTPDIQRVRLPADSMELTEEDVQELILQYDMFDQELNNSGSFCGYLVDNGDGLTVTDKSTGIMWQRGGIDIMSHRMMDREIESLNREKFAGYDDWHKPTLLEALSLMRAEQNEQGVHIHPCFSVKQPFIFVNATRKPGGYWFVDYRQGRTYWASGTIPGAFGRLCRKES